MGFLLFGARRIARTPGAPPAIGCPDGGWLADQQAAEGRAQ
jgi:hypothetical protein